MSEPTKTKFEPNLKTGELTVERTFNAPVERVFAAWSSAEAVKQWWGPRVFPTTYAKMDFRVGGRWHYCMTGPAGEEAWGVMVYDEIEVPTRIVYTDHFADKDGKFNEQMPSTQVTVTFEDLGDGRTRLVSHTTYKPEELRKVLDMGMEPGISETFDKLEEYLGRKIIVADLESAAEGKE
jgi:uncharacterized protein YndB with AHSA1/START domain